MLLQRIFAIAIIVAFGFGAVYGWKLMRDALFYATNPEATYLIWWKFIGGLVLFLVGISFLGGFIYYRDLRKKRIRRKKRIERRKLRESKKE